MLQEYIPNVSVVLFLGCSKCFHVAGILSRCCICLTHMLQVYAPYVSSVLRLMLHSSVSCCKCFVFQRYVVCSESHGGTTGTRESRGPTDGAHGVPRGPADRACSSSSRLSGLAHAERKKGVERS
jgi:hypothetical protein